MSLRHKNTSVLPRIWLMTDPRFGEGLMAAVQRLPFRSGVIFRHYDLDEAARHILFQHVARICRRRGHILLLAGTEQHARKWHADGFHNRVAPFARSKSMLRTAPVHSPTEIAQAKRAGADLTFLSPTFATASHSGARPLGRRRFMDLAGLCKCARVIALGGVCKQHGPTFNTKHIHGWAGIDAFR